MAAAARRGAALLAAAASVRITAGDTARQLDVSDHTLANQCDIVSNGAVCANRGSSVLLPSSVSTGLVGHWTFDQEDAIDASGRGNHGQGALFHGPSPLGAGNSAYFETNFLTIRDSESLRTEDFTYSFWVYVPEEAQVDAHESPRWCPLLRKGVYLTSAEEFANAPALLFKRRTGHLRAAITTTASGHGDGEHMDSHARVLPNRWVHLALVHHGPTATIQSSRLLLYVNGILDARIMTNGRIEENKFPLYVGGDPFTAEQCGFKVYIDELRVHARALAPHELQAEAAPALAGADPSFVHLGCMSCSLDEAIRSCPKDRHICSALELHTGGYQVARSIGWLMGGMHVWTQAAVQKRVSIPAPPTVEYVRCAEEGETCACSGEVAYGTGRSWSQWVSATGGTIPCNASSFGAAPADGNSTGTGQPHCACRQAAKQPSSGPNLGLALCCEGDGVTF